jgi:hypothetical protein
MKLTVSGRDGGIVLRNILVVSSSWLPDRVLEAASSALMTLKKQAVCHPGI